MRRYFNNKIGTWLAVVLLFVLCVPFFVAAAVPAPAQFQNPLGGTTIYSLLGKVIGFLLGLVGLLAMLALVWGGIQFIISFGDETKLKSAKQIVYAAISGLLVVTLSYLIIRVVTQYLLGVT